MSASPSYMFSPQLTFETCVPVNPHVTRKSLAHVSVKRGLTTFIYQIFIERLLFAGHCAELIRNIFIFKTVAFWLICAGETIVAKEVEETEAKGYC